MMISHSNTIPGLFSKGFEFLAVDFNKVEAMHDRRVLGFSELPESIYAIIRSVMGNPYATIDEMEVYVFQRWGGMDDVPDINEDGVSSVPEYLPGISPAYYDNGRKVSESEIRVLKRAELSDKAIADQLFISPNTVARHFQSLFINSGISALADCNKRTALASWAKRKGIM